MNTVFGRICGYRRWRSSVVAIAAILLIISQTGQLAAEDKTTIRTRDEIGDVPPAVAAEVIKFEPLEAPFPVTSFTLSEDGKFLVLSHQIDNKVTVWDAASRMLLTTIETQAPRSLLFRGDSLYVANYGQGTISSFSVQRGWKPSKQFEVKKPNVMHLSAPGGKEFKGILLVTCHNSGIQGSYEGPVVFAVNTKKDKVTSVGAHALAQFSCDGKFVLTQGSFNLSPSGGIGIYNANDFLMGKANAIGNGGIQQTPYVYQVQPGPFWISNHMIFTGNPLNMVRENLGNILIPDHSQPLVYALTPDRVVAHRLEKGLKSIGERKAIFSPETQKAFEGVYHMVYRHREYMLDHHIAWTASDELRMFVLDVKRGELLTAVTTAFVNGPTAKPTEAKPAENAAAQEAPMGELGVPTKIAVNQVLKIQLKGPNKAEYELIAGPDEMYLTAAGELNWKPTAQQVGTHQLKIRVQDGKTATTVKPSIEVIGKR